MDEYDSQNYELRECATLGTNFADIYYKGELFARELSRPVAESLCANPIYYANIHVDIPKIRTWYLEYIDVNMVKRRFSEEGVD